MTRRRFFQAFAAVMITVCLLVLSGVLSAQGNSENAFERVKEVQERHTEALMAKEGVVGTAVGLNDRGRGAVLVLLESPGIGGIPQELEGVPVHPVVTGKIYALPKPGGSTPTLSPASRWPRPVPIGVSTGHPAITAGTIGCRVKAGTSVYALSNNHVYANENNATIGDPVLQPGRYDGGVSPADDIGNLTNFVFINFYNPDAPPAQIPLNWVDAAIASTTLGQVANATPSNGYGKPKSTTVAAAINMPVKKYGRTTGLTKGKVYALNATVNVGYGTGRAARFANQIIITPGTFSAGGDSGSLVVGDRQGKNTTNDRKPVGLLFAGSSLYTIANPIGAVLDAFGVAIDAE